MPGRPRRFQYADVHNTSFVIGDDPSTWNAAFAETDIHGVFLLASGTAANIAPELANIQSIWGSSITEMLAIMTSSPLLTFNRFHSYRLNGAARPDAEQGHEHFGFMDGISQPAVNGFTNPVLPGQTPVDPGTFLLGETGDPGLDLRPHLGKRWLLVPEFNQFLTDNLLEVGELTPEQGSELLGARMVGRWKSGAPIFLSPTADDPVLAADPNRNNNFTYLLDVPNPNVENHFNQTNCPFGAHIRKVHPRGDLDPAGENSHFIIRSSIPYGPEVTAAETASSTTSVDRGLAFVSYQASISNGFMFLQSIWINNVGFIFGKVDPTIGVDPIIGTLGGGPKNISGLNPLVPVDESSDFHDDPWNDVVIPKDFVISRGGEYFFSPSLSGLGAIAAA
ncbi:Dye-decolorizing peroxidase [Mycena venus]|uniref:Dye-decolorizing peroxidase n=1 Tax=Mycena venus TaxID=2733690 RepID=A0A8H7CRV3_9AGAR|nr:Dye-decolorizing peroxidase [Mycena venus]